MTSEAISVVRIKICGNTDPGQVDTCVRAGADCLGFVVEYPLAVPWNLSRREARDLLALVPPMVSRAVVTGGPPQSVLDLARFLRPHLVQLHTDNPLAETAEMARELASLGICLVRALRIDVATGQACGEIPDPVAAALALQESGVSAILLDARTETLPAGTGMRVDWETASQVRESLRIPLILAGGLSPVNVRGAIRMVRPYGVDVITGVETSRRVKDPALVRQFVQQVLQEDS